MAKSKRVLSVFTLVTINIVAIDSLRSLPINAQYGYSIIFFYLLAAIVFFIPCTLVAAELATGWPRRGGAYVWVREAFGKRWGFVAIWLQWIYNVVWYPTILVFIATSLANLIHPAWVDSRVYMVVAVLVIFCLATLLNSFGMRLSGWLSEMGAVLGTIIPMTLISILGIIYVCVHHLAVPFTWHTVMPDLHHLSNLSFLVVVVFSLMGIEMSGVHAEDVKRPERDYPRALLISACLILTTLILSSLAVAVVMPAGSISLVDGLNQAFKAFFEQYHMGWFYPIIEVLIVVGGFGGMAAWVLGPAKGLFVAAQDRCAPRAFIKANRFGAPHVLLCWQAIIVLILSSAFLIMPSVNSAYWLLSDLTAQLAVLYYATLFVSTIRLRYSQPKRREHAFQIPGGKWGAWGVCLLGLLACFGVLAIGFIPPDNVKIGHIWLYEGALIAGIVILVALPLYIYQRTKKFYAKASS
jgi:glutamate:GABA antiporter